MQLYGFLGMMSLCPRSKLFSTDQIGFELKRWHRCFFPNYFFEVEEVNDPPVVGRRFLFLL